LKSASLQYANALADIALAQGAAAPTAKQLADFAAAYAESAELRTFLASPAVTQEAKHGVVEKIAAQIGASKIIRNFLFVIVDHHRTQSLPEIVENAALWRFHLWCSGSPKRRLVWTKDNCQEETSLRWELRKDLLVKPPQLTHLILYRPQEDLAVGLPDPVVLAPAPLARHAGSTTSRPTPPGPNTPSVAEPPETPGRFNGLVGRSLMPLPRERRAAELPRAPQRELPGGLHLHLHGLSAEDLAAIFNRGDG
jgi:hypothetical protein